MLKKNEIKELTSIRFLAAIHVVLFHNINMMGSNIDLLPHWLLNVIGYGYSGVTFFFILSGFILTYVYSDKIDTGETSKSQFYYARFTRIYPVYLLAFILDLPRGVSYFSEIHSPLKMITSSLIHLTMLQSWHPRLATVWNSPAWSLSTEVFFYLLFPFVLPFVLKTKKNLFWIILFYLIPLIIYSAMVFRLKFDLESGIHEVFWRSFPLIRMFEFLIGIFLGKLFIQNHGIVLMIRKHTTTFGYFFWLLTLGSLLLISQDLTIPHALFPNLILLPIFSIMILILTSVKIPMAFLLRNKLILILGSSSYALYIFHRPMEPYIEKLVTLLPYNFFGSTLIIYLAIMITMSILAYFYIELPAQKLLRQKTFSPKK